MAYPSNVSEILKLMGYKSFVDYIVADDGDGPYIKEWMHDNTMPTEEEINTFYTVWQSSPDRLASLKIRHKNIIDNLASDIRKEYITTTYGQDLVYIEKAKNAQAYKDAVDPTDPTDFPWVLAEAEALGSSLEEAVDIILTTRDLWSVKGAQIEKERIKYKREVDKSQSIAEINEVEGNYLAAFETLRNS